MRPQRAADLGGHLRRQPPRQQGPDTADARHPADPLPLGAPAPPPDQVSRGQGLRLRPPARPAAPSTDRATLRPGRHRWVVECTMSWLNGCRRLHRRYERTAEHLLAFVGIASALICYRRLVR
ncbi:transposase [Streptomyces coelicoflavus]